MAQAAAEAQDAPQGSPQDAPRERLPFDADWRFHHGDPGGIGDKLTCAKICDFILPSGNEFRRARAPATRPTTQIGAVVSFAWPDFDDNAWRRLDLPHDWGNGDATNIEGFQSPSRLAFNGLALVIVRAKAGQSGAIRLRATTDGLHSAEVELKALISRLSSATSGLHNA